MTIVLAIVPPDDEPHKELAIAKVIGSTFLLIGAGVMVFLSRKRRSQT
jgi:glutamate:GABA antiporter